MKTNRRTVLASLGAAATGMAATIPAARADAPAVDQRLTISSPDGRTTLELLIPTSRGEHPRWAARHGNSVMLEPSRLALVLADGKRLGPDARFLGSDIIAIDGTWDPPYGIAARYDGRASQLEARFEDRRTRIRFAIRLLAHDDGIACRFVLMSAPGQSITLGGEQVEFRMPTGTRVWTSRDEGEYAVSLPGRIAPVPHPELTASTDKGALADTPALAQTSAGLAMLLCESDRLHYPRMMLAPGEDEQTMVSRLMHFPGRATGYSGPGDTHALSLIHI